jgi:hypothetical protein
MKLLQICRVVLTRAARNLCGQGRAQRGRALRRADRLFLYKRDEGGFGGWVAKRLRMSRKTADRFIDVFNAAGRVANLATLDVPISGLYC